MRIKCNWCRYWDMKKQKSVYGRTKRTDWRPSRGINPFMREFACKTCGKLTYKVLTLEQLRQANYEDEQKRLEAEAEAKAKPRKERLEDAKTTNTNHS